MASRRLPSVIPNAAWTQSYNHARCCTRLVHGAHQFLVLVISTSDWLLFSVADLGLVAC
jgi:hypothetical protein